MGTIRLWSWRKRRTVIDILVVCIYTFLLVFFFFFLLDCIIFCSRDNGKGTETCSSLLYYAHAFRTNTTATLGNNATIRKYRSTDKHDRLSDTPNPPRRTRREIIIIRASSLFARKFRILTNASPSYGNRRGNRPAVLVGFYDVFTYL